MTDRANVEIRVDRVRTILLALVMTALVIVPPYIVYFTNVLSDNPTLKFTCLPIAIFLGYYTYRLLIQRLLMGPIIILTTDLMVVRDKGKVHQYRWSEIRTVKVEIVTVDNAVGPRTSKQPTLTIWSTTKKGSDSYPISDLERDTDEIRSLINEYRDGTAANKMHVPLRGEV